MNIEKLESLTGLTITPSQQDQYKASIARTRSKLESMLGYSLSKRDASNNYYEELGKTQSDFECPEDDTDNLAPPDDVIGSYRLFPYNARDRYIEIDPFTQVHAVKLVVVQTDRPEQNNGVTVKTFDRQEMRVNVGAQGFRKFIERCPTCSFPCDCGCTDCVQIAVDANWLNEDCLPSELLYVWVDMIQYDIDCKKNIKRETLGPHTYEKFTDDNPLSMAVNRSIIERYAGPNGTLHIELTV